MGILNVYSLVDSFTVGSTFGWQYTIVLMVVIFFVGAFLMGFVVNYGMLIFDCFVAGIGV
jgi:MFS family permease